MNERRPNSKTPTGVTINVLAEGVLFRVAPDTFKETQETPVDPLSTYFEEPPLRMTEIFSLARTALTNDAKDTDLLDAAAYCDQALSLISSSDTLPDTEKLTSAVSLGRLLGKIQQARLGHAWDSGELYGSRQRSEGYNEGYRVGLQKGMITGVQSAKDGN